MKRLSNKERARVFALYGPTSGRAAQGIRNEVATLFRFTPDHQFSLRGLTEKEKDMFVKFVRVMRFNMFNVDGGKALYEQITRFSHSCAPNCAFSFTGTEIACRVIKPIASGEELTISYIPSRDAEPIHERRLDHLIGKEFTCHCPRCDAAGDDTRQFDCFDPVCKGVMMVCQPLNQKPIRIPDLSYTGVESVEPQLLPCTVCHRAAPIDYQARIFKVEAVLSDLAAVASRDFAKLSAPARQADVEALLQDIFPSFPRRHAACWPVLMVQAKCYGLLTPSYRDKLAGVVRECIASMESVFPNPNDETCGRLMEICGLFCSRHSFYPVFTPQEEKELWQKALRMHLILNGRESRELMVDTQLPFVLEKLPAVCDMTVCAFCEESPLCAALTLKQCGRCKNVSYCSEGCQKAHWKLHKKTCSAV